MPVSKEECPECSTHTVTFSEKAAGIIYDLSAQGVKRRKKRSIEQIVNKLIEKTGVKDIDELFDNAK